MILKSYMEKLFLERFCINVHLDPVQCVICMKIRKSWVGTWPFFTKERYALSLSCCSIIFFRDRPGTLSLNQCLDKTLWKSSTKILIRIDGLMMISQHHFLLSQEESGTFYQSKWFSFWWGIDMQYIHTTLELSSGLKDGQKKALLIRHLADFF